MCEVKSSQVKVPYFDSTLDEPTEIFLTIKPFKKKKKEGGGGGGVNQEKGEWKERDKKIRN